MKLFLLNILLALLWAFMWGRFDGWTLLVGFLLGYLLLAISPWHRGRHAYSLKLIHLLTFFTYFVRILVQANLQVAREVLTPGYQMHPRIIAYPVEGMTDVQITTFANAISLTPGTLSVDVAEDGRTLYVHAMYASDRAEAIGQLDELRQRLAQEVFES